MDKLSVENIYRQLNKPWMAVIKIEIVIHNHNANLFLNTRDLNTKNIQNLDFIVLVFNAKNNVIGKTIPIPVWYSDEIWIPDKMIQNLVFILLEEN